MPSRVLLRGFAPDIPEDQVVTFCDDLPSRIACAQCDNVSAVLYRDPRGHGYCFSCMNMCSNLDGFQCPECQRKFERSKLIIDRSVGDKLNTMKIICPKTVQGTPVQITFSALKAHLEQCYCNQVADDSADAGQPASLPFSSLKICKCPRCNEEFTKKHIREHVKVCTGRKKPQSTQQQLAPCPEAREQGPGTRTGFGQLARFSDVARQSPATHEASSPSNDVPVRDAASKPPIQDNVYLNLSLQLSDAQREIRDLKDEVSKLKVELCSKNNDIEFLTVAVQTIQEDMRNVQIKCEQRIEKVEKTNSDLEESCTSVHEIANVIKEETERRQSVAEKAVVNLNANVAASFNELKEECNKLRAGIDECFAGLNQLSQNFEQQLQSFVDDLFPSGQEQGRHDP